MQRLPALRTVERAPATSEPRPPRGQVYGEGGGVRVVFDVVEGTASVLAADGKRTRSVSVPCAHDPLTPGLVAVDDAGKRALVMGALSPHGDAWLVRVDFEREERETLHMAQGPSWVVGGFLTAPSKRGAVVLEQRLGESPRFSVIVKGKRVWRVDGMQQPCVPCALPDDVLALVVCPQPDASTGTGPSSLCVLDLTSGTLAALCPAAGTRVRLVETGKERALVVDGGRETVRVVLA